MAIIYPQRKAADSQTANSTSATRPVLGPDERLQRFRFGRPRRMAQVEEFAPGAFTGGAGSADLMFRPREASDGQ